MSENEVNIIYTVDYIYIPYNNSDELNINEDKKVYKDKQISIFNGEKIYSPVSGMLYGLSELNSYNGPLNVLVIENDFKDKVDKKIISIEDIYKAKVENIKRAYLPKSKKLSLYINSINNYDLKDEYILEENINIVLETLDLISLTYPNLKVVIKIDKRNTRIYQKLFTFLGTYPNIGVEFITNKEEEDILSLYNIIDIYTSLKKCRKRDYVYFTLIHSKNISVIKTKRYSNLDEILKVLGITANEVIINLKRKFTNTNILLDDNIDIININ